MASYRFTMGFRQGGRTATETYYHDASTLADAGVLGEALIAARAAMLFESTEIIGIRIGLADKVRQGQLYIPGDYTDKTDGIKMIVPEKGAITNATGNSGADQPNACIQMLLRYGDDRTTKRYLAFIPDLVVVGRPGSVQLNAEPRFLAAYTAFQKLLIENVWQIRARLVTGDFAEKPIQGWAVSDMAPGLLGAVLVAVNAPALLVGDKVAIKGVRRKGTDKVSYNAIYRVKLVVNSVDEGTRTVYLSQTQGADAESIKVLGKLQKVDYGPFPISRWAWFRAGTHKRGGSFGQQRGRRSTRQLL